MRKLNIFEPHKLQKKSFEGLDDQNFLRKKRQVLVFTEVGKPVFTRYGDETAFSSLFASLTTVIQKFLYQSPKKDNELKCLKRGASGSVFFIFKEKFLFVCVSKKPNENGFLLKNMLMFLYTQIISLITGHVNKIMDAKVSYDPRNLLGGTDKSLLLAIKNSLNSPSIFLNAFPTLFMSPLTRARIQGILNSLLDESMLAAIMLTPVNIIAFAKSKGIQLHATDFMLILHLIQSNLSLKNCENWVPICLQGISDEGYVYAYIHFYSSNIGIVMLTGESSSDLFYEYSQKCKSLVESLQREKIENVIDTNLKFIPISPTIISYSGLNACLIRSHYHKQYITMGFPNYGIISKDHKGCISTFAGLYEKLVNHLLTNNQREYCEVIRESHEEFMIYSNENYSFITRTFRNESLSGTHRLIKEISKWLKENSENHFFN